MEENKKLSIIIVAFYNTKHLVRCVASIYEKLANFPFWEIIIVNNDKNQSIGNLPIDYSRVKIIDHGNNVGFGSGINLGTKAASGYFLLFLNPDTQILTANADELLEEFSKNKDVGIIGSGIINEDNESHKWIAGQELSLYELIRNNLGINRSRIFWNSTEKTECDWVSGTSLFIRKKLFDELGGFDENFFMYFEDMDLCRRAKRAGYKIVYFPAFKIFHSGGESYVDKKLQKRHYYDSLEYYFKKYGNFFSQIVVKISRKLLIRK